MDKGAHLISPIDTDAFTAGKQYPIVTDHKDGYVMVVDDSGAQRLVYYKKSQHLGGLAFERVEEL